jgi:hypothetical protein
MGNPPSRANTKSCAKKVRDTEIAKNILSITVPSGRIISRMTRARTASFGVAILTAIQPLLGAVLMLCVSLVQGAATTLGMIFNRRSRDWHTEDAQEALPQATSGISIPGPNSTHGVILGQAKRDPRISVGTPRGLAVDPHETGNLDSRHKAENDSVAGATSAMEADKVRVPREGGGPVLRAAQTHAHQPYAARTALSPLIPANAGIRSGQRGLSRLAASIRCVSRHQPWSPTCVGMRGAMRAMA